MENSPQEQNVRQAVPLLLVNDMTRSYRFYVDGLGFRMTRDWTVDGELRWCWLEHGSAALMLQEYLSDGHTAQAQRGKLGEGVTIYFICADALSIYRALQQRGIQASRPVVGNGMWETHLADPDGYQIAFESLTDTPEDTLFGE